MLAIALILNTHSVSANCVNAMLMPVSYDLGTKILNIPLAELAANPQGDSIFAKAQFLLSFDTLPTFGLVSAGFQDDDKCKFIPFESVVYDFNTNEITLPQVQVLMGPDTVAFFSATLEPNNGKWEISFLEPTEGRYVGFVYDNETHKALKGATVSLDGVEAYEKTNYQGFFTIYGIGPKKCQTLAVNAPGFAPSVIEVDITAGGLKACPK